MKLFSRLPFLRRPGLRQVSGLLAMIAVILSCTTSLRAQPSGGWLQFNNTGGFVTAPHDPSLHAYPITIMGWYKALPFHQFYLLEKSTAYGLQVSDSFIQCYYKNAQQSYANAVYGLNAHFAPDGQWHHVAMVVDFTEGSLYYDGVLTNHVWWYGPEGVPTNNSYLQIGRVAATGDLIDEVSLWQKKMSQGEIQSHMFQPLVGNEAGLLAYWRFNEASGTTAFDSSGHGHNATFFRPQVTITNPGYNLNFNGAAGDFAQVPANPALTPDHFTMEAWVNPSAAACSEIIGRGSGTDGSTTDYGFIIGYDGANCGVMKVALLAVNAWDASSSSIPLNTWTHVAVTFDGANKRFYINGVLDRTVSRPGVPFKSGQPMFIGRQGNCGCSYFYGKMEEVRLWNTVRTQSEIAQNMNRSLTGNVLGLVACYPFEEGVDKTIADATGHGYNATISGGSLFPWAVTTAPLGPPDISVPAASGVSTVAATLNANVHPKAQNTRAWFEWGLTTNYNNTTSLLNPGTGYGFAPVNSPLINLLPGTFYHFRFLATNGGGTAFSADQTFRTGGDVPSIINQYAITPSPVSIIYQAQVIPNQVATTVTIEWGFTNTFLNSQSFQIGSGTMPVSLSNSLNGLFIGTNYIFRTTASNSVGVSVSSILDVVTPYPAITTPASVVGTNEAVLQGYIHPGGLQTRAWFEWGLDTSYGNTTAIQTIPGWTDYTNLTQFVSQLAVANIYHFRIVSSNSLGMFYGADQSYAVAAFLNVDVGLPNYGWGNISWGDYDNDGLLDALGVSILHNTPIGFVDVTSVVAPGFPQSFYALSTSWCDYDNDGLLDFLITGGGYLTNYTQIWHNAGNGFSNVTAAVAPDLPQVANGSGIWGDYDNDGKPDFLICGTLLTSGVEAMTQIWRNTGSNFVNVTDTVAPNLTLNYAGAAEWGDYDNDGWLDLILCGSDGTNIQSCIWRNTGGGFTNVTSIVAPDLPNVYAGTVTWGDYDDDGLLDFLIAGYYGPLTTQVWRNTGNGFTNATGSFASVFAPTFSTVAAWQDFDNDGRTDLFLSGRKNTVTIDTIFQAWRNTGDGFTNVTGALFPDFGYATFGSVDPADYDNDGRADLIIGSQAGIWRNHIVKTNTPPMPPTVYTTIVSNSLVEFIWNAGSDAEAPISALTYNLRVGTAPAMGNIISAEADSATGFRRLPARGNRQISRNMQLNLGPGTYYWSVQTVDSAFAGGPFALEKSFTVTAPRLNIVANGTTVTISWPALPGWTLQQNPFFPADTWIDVLSNETNSITVPAGTQPTFFRLFKP